MFRSGECVPSALVATVENLEAEIAGRFDTAMDRVTGWYVRQTKLVLFVIGFSLAVVTNFDVIRYAGDLVKNEDLRAKIVAQAEVIGNAATFIEAKEEQETALTLLSSRWGERLAARRLDTARRVRQADSGLPAGCR